MDSFELNKILGAILGTCLGVLSINIAAGAIFAPVKPAKPGYDIAVPETKPRRGRARRRRSRSRSSNCSPRPTSPAARTRRRNARPATPSTRAARTSSAPICGASSAARRASEAGFNYSAAIKAKGGNWTIDDLNQFITNPKAVVPGTNMTFAGINRGSERADLIAYLNTLSDNPAPLPKAAEAPGAPKAQ